MSFELSFELGFELKINSFFVKTQTQNASQNSNPPQVVGLKLKTKTYNKLPSSPSPLFFTPHRRSRPPHRTTTPPQPQSHLNPPPPHHHTTSAPIPPKPTPESLHHLRIDLANSPHDRARFDLVNSPAHDRTTTHLSPNPSSTHQEKSNTPTSTNSNPSLPHSLLLQTHNNKTSTKPFQPPPSLLPPKYQSLDTNDRLEILTNRLGLWFKCAPLITALIELPCTRCGDCKRVVVWNRCCCKFID